MVRARRWLALILALAIVPGTLWRSQPPERDTNGAVTVKRLALPAEPCLDPAATLCAEAAWALSSRHSDFGGYSALVADGPDRFLAFSDRGAVLSLPRPGRPGAFRFLGTAAVSLGEKRGGDVESAARTPDGTVWRALEGRNVVESDTATIVPPGLETWPDNTGPEALAALPDGRLLLISESHLDATGRAPALLFDPARPAEARALEVDLPAGYSATGADTLQDGRVIVLLRAFRWMPPGFVGRLAVLDPRRISPDGVLTARAIGRWAAPLPVDNYESLVAEEAADGSLTLWLISDDNEMLLQRTLMMRLRWTGWQEP